jgi:hypothetical protein
MLDLDFFGGHAIPLHIEKQCFPPFTKCEGIAIGLNFFVIIICKAIIKILCHHPYKAIVIRLYPHLFEGIAYGVWNMRL